MLKAEINNNALPESSRHLRWMLARKLGVAAIVIGLAAGDISYLVETRRAEQMTSPGPYIELTGQHTRRL